MFYEALDYIYSEKYPQALKLLYHLDSIKLESFLNQKEVYGNLKVDSTTIEKVYVKYLIGTCFLEQNDKSKKALSYIEYVEKSGYSSTPDIIYKDLGDLYHLDYQFDKSIYYFNRFLSRAKPNDEFRMYASQMIKTCQNAKALISDTVPVKIKKMPYPINTEMNESKPMGTIDDSRLFLSRSKIKLNERNKYDTINDIWAYTKFAGVWTHPVCVKIFGLNKGYSLAGVSPRGDKIYLAVGDENQKALYEAQVKDSVCFGLNKLPFSTPKFNDTEISFSADGTQAYFVSSRPGGYGGSDIYRVEKRVGGEWTTPENVGPEINSEFDEASPALKQDGRSLYFSSMGHNSMGGFDLFEANFVERSVKNMGFPINSPNDNKYISIADSGRIAYFSSSTTNKRNSQDIYEMDIKKDIPYTMIRGTLKISSNTDSNIRAKIKVINKKQPLTMFNTNPDVQTGNYFIFFPPGQEYTILVDADGYLPQMINIKVPNQNYFYELRQELVFSHLKLMDKVIGEQVQVVNNFSSNGTKFSYADLFDEKKRQGYDSLVKLVKVVSASELKKQKNEESTKVGTDKKDYDKLLFLIQESIEKGDTNAISQLNRNTEGTEAFASTFFYNKDKNNTLLPAVQIGPNEFVYTAPPINAYDNGNGTALNGDVKVLIEGNKTISNSSVNIPVTDISQIDPLKGVKKEVSVSQIFFENGKYDLLPKYNKQISDVTDLMIDNPSLFLEISGYSNSIGDSIPNLKLSEDRARTIKNALIANKIPESKIRVFFYGDSKTKNETSENDIIYNRRVDVILYNLENKLR